MSYQTTITNVTELVELPMDAYTRDEMSDTLIKLADLTSRQAEEAIDNGLIDGEMTEWRGYLFPKCTYEYQVVLPRRRWSVSTLRSWIMRGFDRVYTLVPELVATGMARKYITWISRPGADKVIDELWYLIVYDPSRRWPGRPYRFIDDRFFTCFGITQPVALRYSVIYVPPPEERRYAGHLRWGCGAKGTGKEREYRFIRELTVYHDTSETDPDKLDDIFKRLIDCILDTINYPEIDEIIGVWNETVLGGGLAEQFEVTEVTGPKGELEHPDGYWAYIEYRATTHERLSLIRNGVIDTDKCLEG